MVKTLPLSNCDGEDDGAEKEILITTFSLSHEQNY